nr:hypothetical protein Iba_chr15dCG7680 [Ipomoea batatas]
MSIIFIVYFIIIKRRPRIVIHHQLPDQFWFGSRGIPVAASIPVGSELIPGGSNSGLRKFCSASRRISDQRNNINSGEKQFRRNRSSWQLASNSGFNFFFVFTLQHVILTLQVPNLLVLNIDIWSFGFSA